MSDNPVLWREVRRPLTTRRWQAVLASVLCAGLLLISYAVLADENALDDPEAQVGYAFVFHGLLWLLVSVLSATAIAQEKESDTWTLLLTTPVRGATIVFGKAAGLLRRVMWPFLFAVGHFALFTVTGVISVTSFLLIVWVMVAFNSVWIATGIYLSLRLRKVTFAVILNLLLAVLIYPVVAVVLLVGGELVRNRAGEAYAEQVAWYLPYSYLAIGVEGLDGRYRSSQPEPRFWLPRRYGFGGLRAGASFDYRAQYVTAWEYLGVVFVVGCVYMGVGGLILLRTARRFDRIVGRAQQDPAAPPAAPAGRPQLVAG